MTKTTTRPKPLPVNEIDCDRTFQQERLQTDRRQEHCNTKIRNCIPTNENEKTKSVKTSKANNFKNGTQQQRRATKHNTMDGTTDNNETSRALTAITVKLHHRLSRHSPLRRFYLDRLVHSIVTQYFPTSTCSQHIQAIKGREVNSVQQIYPSQEKDKVGTRKLSTLLTFTQYLQTKYKIILQ